MDMKRIALIPGGLDVEAAESLPLSQHIEDIVRSYLDSCATQPHGRYYVYPQMTFYTQIQGIHVLRWHVEKVAVQIPSAHDEASAGGSPAGAVPDTKESTHVE